MLTVLTVPPEISVRRVAVIVPPSVSSVTSLESIPMMELTGSLRTLDGPAPSAEVSETGMKSPAAGELSVARVGMSSRVGIGL